MKKGRGKARSPLDESGREGAIALNADQRERYSRHLLLPEFGERGQAAVMAARVLLVGVGGLGSPVALYLAAAGVGTLGLLDADTVALSNLQRQVLHSTPDLRIPKVISAHRRLHALNPEVKLELHAARLLADNADELIARYDVVMDCCDNFATRYVLNDSCHRQGKALVYGAVSRFHGQLSVFLPDRGPCYRCLYPDEPRGEPSGGELGLIGAVPGVIGTLQAIECLKLLAGFGEPLSGTLLLFDAQIARFREVALGTDPECAICRGVPGATRSDLT